MSGRSGRSGTPEFQRNRPLVLRASDICGLCGHGGARTVDHIIPKPRWPRDLYGNLLPGFDGLHNLQPAHGTTGSDATRVGRHNRCPTCGKLCNQSKGALRTSVRVRSRNWL